MEKKGLIIFDFDGVIIDSVMLTYTYSKKSLPFLSWKMYQRVFDNPYYIKAVNLYRNLFSKKTSKTLERKRSNYTKEKIKTSALIVGMDSLLEELSSIYELALNTNASNENTMPLLKKYKLKQYFKVIKTRDDTASKTEKSMQILKELDIKPKNSLFVSDSCQDVLDAKKAGIKSICVLTGVHTRKHFERGSVKGSIVKVVKNTGELKYGIDMYFQGKSR